jgi:hypothetical protein
MELPTIADTYPTMAIRGYTDGGEQVNEKQVTTYAALIWGRSVGEEPEVEVALVYQDHPPIRGGGRGECEVGCLPTGAHRPQTTKSITEGSAHLEALRDRRYLDSQHPVHPVSLLPRETIQALRHHIGQVSQQGVTVCLQILHPLFAKS